jgi:pimeloyl-ACP methyl ester carboxylesterase
MKEPDFRTIETNGVRLRVVVEGSGPLLILLHGWPQCWYLWRHQIDPLVAAGYQVAVPDQRGYGGSDAPAAVEDYDIVHLCADVVGVADALGHRRFRLLGHDWGAIVAWHTALLHPERVEAIACLSVPYTRWDTAAMTEQAAHGEDFFYSVYFQRPGTAEAELDLDLERSLRQIYFSASARAPQGLWFTPRPSSQGLLEGLGDFDTLPDWLTREDLDYYVAQYRRNGFRGPINFYRNIRRNELITPQLENAKVTQPAYFMIGRQDVALLFFEGGWVDAMDDFVADLRGKVYVDGAGHWLPVEQPEAVIQGVVGFFGSLPPLRG